jgi:hypothetical protein
MSTPILCAAFLTAWLTAVPNAPAPKYGNNATRLSADHAFIQHGAAPDFWALIPYSVGQEDKCACSRATVAMVINALRAGRELTRDDQLVTQDEVLTKSKSALWATASRCETQIVLDNFAELLSPVFKAYALPNYQVETVHVAAANATTCAQLKNVLIQNERRATDFVIVNFLQSALTDDPEGAVGHIAPVAAFDERHERVLILDPDRLWYEPYWVSLDRLCRAMATIDTHAGKPRGCVWLKPIEQGKKE